MTSPSHVAVQNRRFIASCYTTPDRSTDVLDMSVALKLYEQLSEAQDDKSRARVIAAAFEPLEDRYPPLTDVATQGQLRETELRLQKEIEQVRREIRQLRLEVKGVENGLRTEIKATEVKLAESKAELIRWMVAVGVLQTTLLTGVQLRVAHLI